MRVPLRRKISVAARFKEWGPIRALRASLSLRTAATITVAALVLLLLFSFVVTTRLTSTVFENRRTVVLDDAAIRYSQAHAALEQSTATSPDQVQEVARQVVENIQKSAATSGAVAVVLLRSPEASSDFRINELVPQSAQHLVDKQIRKAVQSSDHAQWQSIELGNSEKNESWWNRQDPIPAIITGAKVNLPRAGEHELYIVYSLENDQTMVSTTMNVLLVATVPVLLLLPFVVFWAIFRLLAPVQQTAHAVVELAQGNLDVRVPVQGEDEMAQLGHAFNNMATSLQTQIREYDELSLLQQRFVSDVSHELRTPLTTIRMAEEMIWDERDDLSAIGKRSAELLHEQVERFESMLADLLEISRLDARSASLEAENTDIRPLVAKVISANDELAQRQNVTVSVDGDNERLAAEIDARRIERILRNLIVNAIEHAESGPVVVTLAGNADCVAVRVRDFGVGMSEETAARVFDRFFRADPARARTTGGTGLGLAIAHEDAALHGGTIYVYGKLGQGSSFMLVLPKKAGETVDLSHAPLPLWEELR